MEHGIYELTEAALALLSVSAVERIAAAAERSLQLELEAAVAEMEGDAESADAFWFLAAVAAEEAETFAIANLEEASYRSMGSEDDEREGDFAPDLQERLLDIARSYFGRSGAFLPLDSTRFREMTPIDRVLGCLSVEGDTLIDASGRRYKRCPLEVDDPRRPPDSTRRGVNVKGEVVGPCYDVWKTPDGRFVSAAGAVAEGADVPNETMLRTLMLVHQVKSAARSVGVSEAVLDNLDDSYGEANVLMLMSDIWLDHKHRVRKARQRIEH